MQQGLLNIFQTLKHFGVDDVDIQYIAEGYQDWLKNPVDRIFHYGTVYSLGNKFYSMPYPIKGLDSLFVGIEINGIVYMSSYRQNVSYGELETKISELKVQIAEKVAKIAKKFDVIACDFELRMPTRDEARALADKARYDHDLLGKIYCTDGNLWITPSFEQPNKTYVTVTQYGAKPHHARSSYTQASLYLVAIPRKSNMFIGEVDDYGIPTPETLRNRLLLTARSENSYLHIVRSVLKEVVKYDKFEELMLTGDEKLLKTNLRDDWGLERIDIAQIKHELRWLRNIVIEQESSEFANNPTVENFIKMVDDYGVHEKVQKL